MSYVHLHTHSEYSLLDGANRIPELLDRVKGLGMDSLAITDHGNLHGAWTFYEQARAAGIKPIIGFEAYVAFGPRTARDQPSWAPSRYSHLVLLAKNRTGYRNLIKLSSIGYVEGYYRRPRIDRSALEEHAEGIVCLSACLSGEVALWLRQDNYGQAKQAAEWFASTFGSDGFWLEVQDHGIPDERKVRDGVFTLGTELGLPVVATNDAHYLERSDHEAHDCLLAIGTGRDLDDPNRFRFYGQESYVKSEAEMAELFPDRPDVIENTQRVANLCDLDFEQRYLVPEFPRPDETKSENELLVELVMAGAEDRYGSPLSSAVAERLEYELDVITKLGYAGYFLIVEDFIRAARDRGIPVGPGRGSVAGSLVAYALHITDIDPLQFDLLFERFLNPDRVSMPDIDVDFCYERRGEVIEYVRERYGRESVGQIITFGTLKARAALRDIARVLRVSPTDADRIAKLIPTGPAFALSVSEAAAKVPELAALVKDDATVRRVIDLAQRIEGLSRHASVHAAGIVIAPGPLHEYVPVCTLPQRSTGTTSNGDESLITQFDMVALEKVGMLKMDFLGLRTLTVIHDALEMIRDRHQTTVDFDHIDLNDPETYALLRAGRTAGVFQFESPLATEMLRQFAADRFDDLVVTNALVRPGPLDSGMHQVYIRRKRGQEQVRYPHRDLEELLAPTYGVIVYQEQVMRIANVLAGFTLAEADVLRKAVGKKDADLIDRELGRFVERSVARGHKRRVMKDIADQIRTFGRYGFNKSHSVAYSILSFQTAWLKAHYPAEFMAALLSSEIGDTDKVVAYINEARELGLEVLPPSVNESGWKFTVTGDTQIRFGLGAIRHAGRGAIESILEAKRSGGAFSSLDDFCQRVDLRSCNKRVLESLVQAGALDQMNGHRAQLIAALDLVLPEAQLQQAEREAGQASLFGDHVDDPPSAPPMPDVPHWSEAERLAREKDVIGFFISGHPLARYREEVQLFGTRTTATLGMWSEHRVSAAVVVTTVKRRVSRKTGAEYARLTLEDFHGTAEALVFPETWSKLSHLIVDDAALLLSGGYSARDRGEDRAPFIVEDAQPLSDLSNSGALALAVTWRCGAGPNSETAKAFASLCATHPGPAPVMVEWSDGNGTTARFQARSVRVELDAEFLDAVRALVGTDQVRLTKADA